MKQLYSQHLPKGFNYPPPSITFISKETYHLNGNRNPHSFYYQSNIQTESIMSKEEIERILNTDFTEIDHTIEEKINSIDEMTGKLNERSGFLAQFQLMLQSELGNIKNTAKMGSKSKQESEGNSIIMKKMDIPKVEEEKINTNAQMLWYNYQPYQPKVKQRVTSCEKPTTSVGINTQQRSFAMERVLSIAIKNLQTQKLRNNQKKQRFRGKLDASKIELEELKLLIAFLKQEIKVEIQYFKEKIALEASQICKTFQSHLQSQHQMEVSSLETELNTLKAQNLKLSKENKGMLQKNSTLKQLTFHKNTEQKMNSLNVTCRLKEVQYYPSQYSSPDRHKISPNQIINSDQWKTYRLRFDQNEVKKTERLQFKQKQPPKDPYTIPSVKTITVGIPPIKNGFGVLKSGNQIIYRGMWKDGKFDGSGKLNWEGYCYEGNFSNGAFQGHGRLHIKDNIFVGKFRANKACGEGTLEIDKKKIVGVWENNHLIRIF